jgi:hypothetical protein
MDADNQGVRWKWKNDTSVSAESIFTIKPFKRGFNLEFVFGYKKINFVFTELIFYTATANKPKVHQTFRY